jgi:hypothetical protein
MKLQMKREALEKLNHRANEMAPVPCEMRLYYKRRDDLRTVLSEQKRSCLANSAASVRDEDDLVFDSR